MTLADVRCLVGALSAVAALGVGVVTVAESSAAPGSVYAGAAGGAVLGVVGFLRGLCVIARHRRAGQCPQATRDVWAPWAMGLVARLAVLAGLIFGLGLLPGIRRAHALISLLAVYQILLLAETWWLSRALGAAGGQAGSAHP
jgi:hypothetical protein